MKIAIVGGSGFIGTHTTVELLREGHDVTIIDIVEPRNNKVKYIHADFTNYHEIQSAIYSLDIVYIFAACKYVNICYNDPVYGVNTNIQGLTNTLQACKNAQVGRVIFSSSVWVYNGCSEDIVNEDTEIPASAPNSLYGYTKLVGEGLVKNFSQSYDLDYTILRYGVAYGPGVSDETVIAKFIHRAHHGKPLQIIGTGDAFRNFLYVADHAKANVLALSDVATNQTFNIEGSERISVKNVADTVQKLANIDIPIEHLPARAGEFDGKTVRIDKAKKILDWHPTIPFNEGMERYYNWYEEK